MGLLELHRDIPEASSYQKRDALIAVLAAAGMNVHPLYKNGQADARAIAGDDADIRSRAIVFPSAKDDAPWGYKTAVRFGFNSRGRGYYTMIEAVRFDYAEAIQRGAVELYAPRPRRAFPIAGVHRGQLIDFFADYHDSSGHSPLLFNVFNFSQDEPRRVQIQLTRDTVQLGDRQIAGIYMEPVTKIQFGRDWRRLSYSFSNHGNSGWLVQP